MEHNQNDNNIRSNGQENGKNVANTGNSSDVAVPSMLQKDVFYRLAKRAEKINSALYLVAGVLSKNDPIASELKTYGVLLVKRLYGCVGRDSFDQYDFGSDALLVVETISSLVTTARTAGYISEMNASILQQEFSKLSKSIQSAMPSIEESGVFGEESFGMLDSTRLRELLGDDESLETDNTPGVTSHTSQQNDVTDIVNDRKTTQNNVGYTKRHTPNKTTSKKSSGKERRDFIVSLLEHHGQATMKDIATRITNCTEKTLQRDLARLIKEGKIEKEGDKRWSLYKIKKR